MAVSNLLILRSRADRFRLDNGGISFNLTIPTQALSLPTRYIVLAWEIWFIGLEVSPLLWEEQRETEGKVGGRASCPFPKDPNAAKCPPASESSGGTS